MKNIKLIHVILIVITIFLLVRYVFYDRYKMPKGANIEEVQEKEIDVYDETINIYSLIKGSNVKILTENAMLDTTTVGEHTVTIKYKYKGIRTYKYDLKYEVVDKVAPIFIKKPPVTASFYVNEASKQAITNMLEKITYGDNYDIYPTIKTEGEVDFSTVGDYKVEFIISDSSKNETKLSIAVTIKERPEKTEEENETEKEEETEENEEEEEIINPFEEQINTYKTSNTMIGIDVSKWQGTVDFKKVKDAGCEFVIIRIGVMKDKDSELVMDNTFRENYKNAKAAGLKVGIYVYSEANNVNTAISNAKFIIDALGGDSLDFPVAFDWESWSYFNSMEMNLHMLNEMYDAFSKTLKEAGYDSMLYASQNYFNNVWLDLKDYKLWVARYSTNAPEITNGNNKYILWQNSNTGKIDGIEGDVDYDIYYK